MGSVYRKSLVREMLAVIITIFISEILLKEIIPSHGHHCS
jgi:hypothetical protein